MTPSSAFGIMHGMSAYFYNVETHGTLKSILLVDKRLAYRTRITGSHIRIPVKATRILIIRLIRECFQVDIPYWLSKLRVC